MEYLSLISVVLLVAIFVINVVLAFIVCRAIDRRYYRMPRLKLIEFATIVAHNEGKKEQVNIAQILEILAITRKIILERTEEDIYDMMRGEKWHGNSLKQSQVSSTS